MGRLSPDIEGFFKDKIDLDQFNEQADLAAKVPPRTHRRPVRTPEHNPPEKRSPARKRAPNVIEYLCSIKELGKVEKLILQLVVNAYLRQKIYQARVKTLQARASCGRATVFRALRNLVPKYIEKISRPGKPNILKPSPLLLTHLGLSPKLRGLAREDTLAALKRGLRRCHRITGTSKGFQHI